MLKMCSFTHCSRVILVWSAQMCNNYAIGYTNIITLIPAVVLNNYNTRSPQMCMYHLCKWLSRDTLETVIIGAWVMPVISEFVIVISRGLDKTLAMSSYFLELQAMLLWLLRCCSDSLCAAPLNIIGLCYLFIVHYPLIGCIDIQYATCLNSMK